MPRAPGTMPVPPPLPLPLPEGPLLLAARSFTRSFRLFLPRFAKRKGGACPRERGSSVSARRHRPGSTLLGSRCSHVNIQFCFLSGNSTSPPPPIGPSFTWFVGGALVAATFPPLGRIARPYALARDIITISVDTHRRFIPREFIPTFAT